MDSNNMSNDVSNLDTSVIPSAPIVQEKTFTQEEVNKIAGARAQAAAKTASEKARREALQEHENASVQSHANSHPDRESLKKEVLEEIQAHQRQQADEYARKQLEYQSAKKSSEYFSKLEDPNFVEQNKEAPQVFGKFNHAAYSHLVSIAINEPNTAELMYHFAQNPILANQYELSARNDPQGTLESIKKLSKEMEQNKQAKQSVKKAHEPLSRVAPSNVGADNQPRDVRYWKSSKLCMW